MQIQYESCVICHEKVIIIAVIGNILFYAIHLCILFCTFPKMVQALIKSVISSIFTSRQRASGCSFLMDQGFPGVVNVTYVVDWYSSGHIMKFKNNGWSINRQQYSKQKKKAVERLISSHIYRGDLRILNFKGSFCHQTGSNVTGLYFETS